MTDALAVTDRLFFEGFDRDAAERLTAQAMQGAEDGELFLEYRESEAISLDDGRIRSASFDATRGFGLRAVAGEAAGYAHAGEISEPALARAAETVRAVAAGHSGQHDVGPRATNARLYSDANPLSRMEFADKTGLLAEIDAYARGRDPRVVQVMASLFGEWQAVQIVRPDGARVADLRPLVRLNVSVVVEQNGRRETGGHGMGGRFAYRAHRRARELAGGGGRGAAPGAGQPGKRAGAGRRDGGGARPRLARHPAARGDRPRAGRRLQPQEDLRLRGAARPAHRRAGRDGGRRRHHPGPRGSLTVDDEGTPTNRTTLIEDGILVGFLQDRQNARLMGVAPTGNGRRQSHAHIPMPRMTNTVMLGGRTRRRRSCAASSAASTP
jgi:TldD protein